MSTVHRFEDLEVWQLAREISRKIFYVTKDILKQTNSGIINQIRNSSGSATDNIAEGFEREGNKEFKQFLYIAKGSAGETRSQLYRLLDQKHITEKEFDDISGDLVKLNQKIRKLINYLKDSNVTGQKYR